MSWVSGVRLTAVLALMLILPGWAALSLSSLWRRWETLQRWIVAIGLSIAFYPVLFYGTRSVLPFLTFGPYKMGTLLLLCALVIGWRMRHHWKEQFAFDHLEWVALGVFGMTLFTRFWIIRDQPYPAWSDSLHHAILTRLTAVQGQLPRSLEPYFPIPLGQYHLGLYSLTATTQWLAQVPAHTALLWTAQVLNGLCGLGVYLVLDRKMGRVGAIVGAVTVGLLSHQPAFYVNWGRFTQLSAQTILLIAWLVTWEALKAWKLPWQEHRARILWQTLFAAGLTGAVFLLHFRVAAFYLPLLAISTLWELWKGRKEGRLRPTLHGVVAVGLASLLITTPAIIEAVSSYVSSVVSSMPSSEVSDISETVSRYYEFPWSTVPYLVASTWLLGLSGFSTAVGLIRRNKLVMVSLLWASILYLVGKAYLLRVPLLSFTNLGAIMIMFYLPIGLVVGSAAEETCKLLSPRWRRTASAFVALALIGGFVTSHARAADVEPYRFFITEEDVAAMEWIRQNSPEDAFFAVNTYFWLPRAPHGTDAGYWIPYFTGRRTTAGVMLLSLGSSDYVSNLVEVSHTVNELEDDPWSIEALRRMGVDYVYLGRKGSFSGPGMSVHGVERADQTTLVYQNAGVSILEISSE